MAIKQYEETAIDRLMSQLPDYITAFTPDEDDAFAIGDGLPRLPRISIRGKVWRYVDTDGTETAMLSPDGSPQSAIYVALVDARPNVSRNYFAAQYDPDSHEGATCFSTDGVRPHPKAPIPQSETCALCPMNRIGSRITDGGKKTRACGMKKDVVIVPCTPTGEIADAAAPVRLGLPAVSAFNLDRLVKETKLKSSGKLSIRSLALRLTFNIESAFPEVQFTPVAILTPEAIAFVEHVRKDDAVVAWVTGDDAPDDAPVADEYEPTAEPAAESSAEPAAVAPQPKAPTATRKRGNHASQEEIAEEQPTSTGYTTTTFIGAAQQAQTQQTPQKSADTATKVASVLERFKAFS